MNARAQTRVTDRATQVLSGCIAAAEYVATQPGGPARALARHRRLADSPTRRRKLRQLRGHTRTVACITAVIAQLADRLPTTPSTVAPAEQHSEPAHAVPAPRASQMSKECNEHGR